MKVTILCENNISSPVPRGLIGEHGLAFFLEGDDINTLFDTGGGMSLDHNAQVMGKDLTSVDRVILSHGHYDHTGGLETVLRKAGKEMPVYVHPDAFKNKIALMEADGNRVELPIGMQKRRESYEAMGARFVHTGGFDRIDQNTALISDIEHPAGWKSFDTRLMTKEGEATINDPFTDDLSMVIETGSGPVVLLGCAHSGIVDILNSISEKSGYKSFHAVIGGTHLEPASPEYTDTAIDTLRKFKVKIIGPTHCTGFAKMAYIASAMPEEFRIASVGSVFKF